MWSDSVFEFNFSSADFQVLGESVTMLTGKSSTSVTQMGNFVKRIT